MLSINDLNIIIKYYAFNLPQRIEELNQLYSSSYIHIQQDDHHIKFLTLIDRYEGYKTSDERQIRLARKLMQRVLQIFQFFKNKSSNQNLLNIIQVKIQNQMDSMVKQSSVPLGQIFSFIHLIAKKGGLIRVPAQKKRISAKSLFKQPLKLEVKVPPTMRFYNRSTINHTKHVKSASLPCQKWKNQDLLSGPFNCLDIDKTTFTKIKQTNRAQVTRDMMRRNEKILSQMRKQQKKWRNNSNASIPINTQQSQQTILRQMKSNSMKSSSWTVKKQKRPLLSRKKQNIMKENSSIFT